MNTYFPVLTLVHQIDRASSNHLFAGLVRA
jgi:hypothetical protein